MDQTVFLKLNKPSLAGTDLVTDDKFWKENPDKIDAKLQAHDAQLLDIGVDVKTFLCVDGQYVKGDGIHDDTTGVQAAINTGGRIIFPSGTYLCGQLTIPSYTQLIGIGKVTIIHKLTSGFVATGWDRAMITNANQPVYTDPSLATRTNAQGVVTNITIENITLDGQNQSVKGIQLIAADYVKIRDVTIKNTVWSSLFLVGIRWSRFTSILVDNCAGDAFAMTDKYFGGKRGFSTHVTFDDCIAQNCGSTPTTSDPIPSMFEVSDGATYVNFINCKAINNNGCGFDFHIHTSDWDIQNITLTNCKSINNTMSTNNIGVSGFVLGQCPLGSTFKNITYDNCTSVGSQTAFSNLPGAQTGYKENVSIIGGNWENSFANGISTNNTVMYIGTLFRSFKISNANLVGVTDSYGLYSYNTGDGIKIDNVSIKGCYIPLGLLHSGGRIELNNTSINVTNPSSTLSTVCMILEADDVVVNGIILNLDASKYSSSILRVITDKKVSLSNLLIENTGTLGNNAIQFDTVGMATLTGCNIKNFTNGVFFSNTSTEVVSVGNNFKGCTNKYNSTPSYIIDVGNGI